MKKLLIVEDDKEINSLMCEYLSAQGYETISVSNGLDAVRSARETNDISLVILDLMLPFRSGDSVLAQIRSFSDVPVIVVSAKSSVASKVELLSSGADDYLTKPFDLDELTVRIETVLRRRPQNNVSAGKELSYKNLTLDKSSRNAFVRGEKLNLTVKEYEILELMLSNPKKLFSKANIYESVWNEPYFSDDSIIKVHMSNLRSKIKKLDTENEYIETVWGMGYRLYSEQI